MNKLIIPFLKINGGALDIEIAQALKISLKEVRKTMEELSASGAAISCSVTRYIDGREISGTSWRLSGSIPVAARGPKIGAKGTSKSNVASSEDD